jgi:hypothetical protein
MRSLVIAALVVCSMATSGCGGAAAAEKDPFEGIEVRSITSEAWDELLAEHHEPPFTQENVDAWMPDVVAAVERFTGRTLGERPAVRVVTRAEMGEAIEAAFYDPEYLESIRQLFGDDSEYLEPIDDIESAARGTFGFEKRDGGGLLLAAENLPYLLRLVGRPSAPVGGVVRLWLVDHVVGCLVDQEVGPIDIDEDEDDWVRVIEHLTMIEPMLVARDGYRLHVMVGVADELDSREALEAILAFRSTCIAARDETESEKQYEEKRRRFDLARAGYAFMREVAPDGGAERAWEVLAHPPRSMAEIFDPSLYTVGRWAWPGEDVVFGELRAAIADGEWRIWEGEIDLESLATLSFIPGDGADVSFELLTAYEGGGSFSAMPEDGWGEVSAWAGRVREDAGGRVVLEFIESFEAHQFQDSRTTRESIGWRFTEPVSRPLTELPADYAARWDRTAVDPVGDRPVPCTGITVWRGRNVVSLRVAGRVPADDELIGLVESMLRGLDRGDPDAGE